MITTAPTTALSDAFVAFSPQSTASFPSDRSAFVFVWGIWALMALAAFAFVARYGNNLPLYDEWMGIVPVLAGEQRVTVGWLWSPHADHRMPLPRLLLLALHALSGYDFRAGAFFNVAALSALTFAMIRVAARIRGETSYADAFFPLALLHWGHYENLLLGWQVQFISSTVLAGTLLLLIARHGVTLPRGRAILAGVCLLLLPLCGANGLVFAFPLALWLGCAGVLARRAAPPGNKHDGRPLVAFAGASLSLVGLYIVSYQKPAWHPANPGLLATLRTSLQFLAMGWGPAGKEFWPWSGLAMAGLLLISALVLVWAVWREPASERFRALGLLLFLVAVACLAFGTGWGRAGDGWDGGFRARYATLAVLALCFVYLVSVVRAPKSYGSLAQVCLFGLMCALFILNSRSGIAFARPMKLQSQAFARELQQGAPASILAERYDHYFDVFSFATREDEKANFTALFQGLNRAGIGLFRQMRAEPALREIALPPVPTARHQMTWHNGIGRSSGARSGLVFALDRPRRVLAIRLQCAYTETAAPAVMQVSWRESGRQSFTSAPRGAATQRHTGPDQRQVSFWVDDTIDQFRIAPDNKPCVFHLSEVVLLVPADAGQAAPSR